MKDGTAMCQSKYTESLHEVNLLDTLLFLLTVTIYTLIINHIFAISWSKKITNFFPFSEKIYMTKKVPISRNDVSVQFLVFLIKRYTWRIVISYFL